MARLRDRYGRARTPTTQGSVERNNGDFQNALGSWMREYKSSYWSQRLPYVMHIKNRKPYRGIGTSPFNALFGRDAFNGLEFINIPKENKEKIKTVIYIKYLQAII